MRLSLDSRRAAPTRAHFDAHDAVLVVLPATAKPTRWPDFPYRDALRRRIGPRPESGGNGVRLATDLPNDRGTRCIVAALADDASAFERLTLARQCLAALKPRDPKRLLVAFPGEMPARDAFAADLCAAILAARTRLPSFRKQRPPAPALAALTVHGLGRKPDLRRLEAEAEGNGLARELTALPGNELDVARYRRRIAALARKERWTLRFLDRRALKRLGAGAFLAVAQGGPEADAGIVHLRYRPRGAPRAPALALVGKGICFDTGGHNLKTARHMQGMHEDMEGSAVALGTLLALSRLKVPFGVDCWLALAENHIGPRAYKPNDVVRAANGTTIEVVHTDAEGRMVLADTLALAARERPGLVIDYATLTGACVYALSTRMSGAFTSRDDWHGMLLEAGRASGERVWPFPADTDFDEALESKVADVKQCTLEGEADHILAARFLRRFLPEKQAWLHLDLAAGNHKGGLAHIPTDVTGFGVRYTLALLLDHRLHERADRS